MRPRSGGIAALHVITLVFLFSVAGFVESVQQHSLNSITNGDFWWHLQTGLVILETRALPHTGLFSQAAALPWTASSWLYDLGIAIGYRMLDLHFVTTLAIDFKVALAILTFVLAGGLGGRFWTAIALSAVTQYILSAMQPLPTFASVLCFAIELLLLMKHRRTPSVRVLYWLPLLFLLWANLQSQFVFGILTLVLFGLAGLIEQRGITFLRHPHSPPVRSLAVLTLASLVAGCITPYGWNSYRVFFAQATSAANPYFADFISLRFRTPQDYLLLLLALSAFLALGMRRSRDLFQIPLLVLCTAAAFHSQRDAWLLALAAVAILADAVVASAAPTERQLSTVTAPQFPIAVTSAVLLLAAASALHPHGRNAMLAEIGEGYPVAAADYIRQHRLPQPLFNPLAWGGFLSWYLPEYPVAIDGRTDLYGDDFNIQYARIAKGAAHFSTFPPLNQAGTLLLDKNSIMGEALTTVPEFKVAYSDNVAVVLVREKIQP